MIIPNEFYSDAFGRDVDIKYIELSYLSIYFIEKIIYFIS